MAERRDALFRVLLLFLSPPLPIFLMAPLLRIPAFAVPIHFDDFFAPLRPGQPLKRMPGVGLDRFAEEVRRSGSQATVIVPEPFVEMEF